MGLTVALSWAAAAQANPALAGEQAFSARPRGGSARAVPTPADPDIDRRLRYIRGELTTNAAGERLWWYGWLGGFGALAAGQAYFYFTEDDPAERTLNLVGGSMSTLGFLGLLVLPNPGLFADRELQEMPERTRPERARKLARGEELLSGAEEATWQKRNPMAVILPMLVSTGTSAYVWARYDAVLPALRNFVGALSVNLFHWWTRPTANSIAARRYRGQTGLSQLRAAPVVNANGGGAALSGRFF